MYVPFAVPGLTPAGIVFVLTKGKAMPPMITTPGGATFGTRPEPARPENAANSFTSLDPPATPTPPARRPFLNNGTPPPFTAVGSESNRSALPVIIPSPVVLPSIERDGGSEWPGRYDVLNEH